jgi:hypothetical protein
MTATFSSSQLSVVLGALSSSGVEPRGTGPAAWAIRVPGREFEIAARLTDDWLCLSVPLRQLGSRAMAADDLPARLLECNTALPHGLKFFFRPNPGLAVGLEVPLATLVRRGPSLRGVFSRFASVWDAVSQTPLLPLSSALSLLAGADGASEGEEPRVDLPALAASSEWPFTVREDGLPAFDFAEGPGSFRALLASWPGGGLRLAAELAVLDSLPPASQRAIPLLLLRLNGLVNMARAALAPRDSFSAAVLEVSLPGAPDPDDLVAALESLSVACACCGEEVQSLFSAPVAERYLEVVWGQVGQPQ